MYETRVHGDKPAVSSSKGYFDRKELSVTAFERTRMPMVLADARQPDYPIVLANQAFLDLTGYAADEVVGRNCRFLQGKGTSPAAVAEVRRAVAAGQSANVELLNYRKNGSCFWNQLFLSPIHDDEGDLAYFFASQIDVTEFKKVQGLEANEHRLLLEVDHRANNVLAVVDSIVRLSNAEDPAIYAASVQQRVQSLSNAHKLLARGGWQAIGLRQIIEAQLLRYSGPGITLNGEAVLVEPDMVQPLSLIFHELADNAVRHGALRRGAAGHVAIDWKSTADGGFRLTWRERGSRPVDKLRIRGFGTAIVAALLEDQLGGRIERDWDDKGLVMTITVPGKRPGQ